MADFPGLKLTNAGRELQAKAQTGQVLLFTRVGLGDGAAPADLTTLTSLVNQRQPLSIQRQDVPGDGTAVLRVILTNQGLAAGFFMRELGVFAQDPDTGEELLYSYSNCGEFADFLPAAGGATLVEQIFDLITIIGDAENVTAVIDDYITIALKSEVDALKPRLMPAGGTVGQMVRKASNAEGDVEYFDPELDGFDVRLTSIEEPRVAVANQRVFTLQKTVTNGLAVYINGERLSRESWTSLSATQLQLDDPLTAGTRVLFVNNEEAGPGRALNVSLTGPTLVYPASSNNFTITDFDSFSVYAATTTVGTVTRSGAALTLDIPAEAPEGTLDLEVTRDNVRATYRIAVGAAAIAAPEILAPVAGATDVTFEPDLAASAFVVYPAGYDSHAETRWQVARDTGFTDLVFDQQGVDNLTAISLAAAGARLDPATRYYVRAQYHGATLVSAWSVALAFNTAATYVRRPMITSPLDGAESVSSSLTLVADAFSVAGGADAHQSSRWQVSAASDFSTVLVDSGWSNSQLTAYAPTGLQQASQYYARVKYRGEALGESEWSPAISFTTSAKLSGTVTNLPGGATARYNHGAAAIDRHFYVFGGMPASGSSPLGDFWRYSVDGAAWSQIASLPASPHRKGHGVVALNGLLHVFGGVSGTASAPAWLSDHKAYNPATDAWISRAPLAVCDAAICADGDDIYAFGGYTGGGYRSGLYKYNAVSNAWETLYTGSSSTNAGAIADASLVKIGNFLYLFGGKDTAGARAALWRYDLSSNVWSQLASAPQGRAYHAAIALHGLMYVFGGVNSTSEFSTALTDLLIYDPATDSWEQAATGLPAGAAMGVDVIDGMIHWFGGLSYPTYGINSNLYRMK